MIKDVPNLVGVSFQHLAALGVRACTSGKRRQGRPAAVRPPLLSIGAERRAAWQSKCWECMGSAPHTQVLHSAQASKAGPPSVPAAQGGKTQQHAPGLHNPLLSQTPTHRCRSRRSPPPLSGGAPCAGQQRRAAAVWAAAVLPSLVQLANVGSGVAAWRRQLRPLICGGLCWGRSSGAVGPCPTAVGVPEGPGGAPWLAG